MTAEHDEVERRRRLGVELEPAFLVRHRRGDASDCAHSRTADRLSRRIH